MATSRPIFAALAGMALLAAGCGGTSTPAPALQVQGQDIAPGYANVIVTQDGIPVGDAAVTVNGQAIPVAAATEGRYYGTYPLDPRWDPAAGARDSTGQPVKLVVKRGPSLVTATATIPEAPVVTSPIDGSSVAPDGSISVTWTSARSPDRFEVSVEWICGPACGGAGVGVPFRASGSSRSLTIPGSALPYGTGPFDISGQDLAVTVFAYEDGAFAGDYEPATLRPGMNLRQQSMPVTVTTGHVVAAP